MTDPDDLVHRARSGDRVAFAALYERHTPMVHGILVSLVRPQEADDLLQDVFLSALRAIDRLTDAERIGPWLASIARNKGRDLLRSRRPEIDLEQAPEPAASQGDGDDDEAERVLGVLRELPEAYRETLSLRLVEGLTGAEIAEQTGLTHGSVRVNLHRGMKLLRERLGGEA
ncbi:MAG: sigma-70 family RNA polymerase sigma factor [bacterium]|nr:sigma-70 family RNA polymerase sigma factor [bacterium]